MFIYRWYKEFLMWLLDKLLGKKKKAENFAVEAETVRVHSEQIIKWREPLRPKNKDDPKQHLKWYAERITILQNEYYHPVARLSFSDRYDATVEDFIRKLKQASAGDASAISEVEIIRVKTPKLIQDELDYLIGKKAKWERIVSEAQVSTVNEEVKWEDIKAKILNELVTEREHLNNADPKNKEDMTQWKSYYRTRVARLELRAISEVVRLVWVTSIKRENRERMINEYLAILDQLIRGEKIEERYYAMKEQMRITVVSEAARLRKNYRHFFIDSTSAIPIPGMA